MAWPQVGHKRGGALRRELAALLGLVVALESPAVGVTFARPVQVRGSSTFSPARPVRDWATSPPTHPDSCATKMGDGHPGPGTQG